MLLKCYPLLLFVVLSSNPIYAQQPCWLSGGHPMPVVSAQSKQKMEADLNAVLKRLESNPKDLDALVWAGRRTAYLGNYYQSLDFFTRAMELHPGAAAPYRHRGHRYITLRCFDKAIYDFERAVALTTGIPDEVEPDGMPNDQNIPTSTLQSNIWYHLGLAHYLKGDFERAVESYKACLAVSRNPDMYIATANWYYLALLRAGKKEAADNFLAGLDLQVTLIENQVYLRLLQLHRQGKVPDDPMIFLQRKAGLEGVTYAYGLGAFLLVKGEKEKARQVFQHMLQLQQWGAFGCIAAEVEMKRL
jgi:tetratricopeptide (TPR) repeat protein